MIEAKGGEADPNLAARRRFATLLNGHLNAGTHAKGAGPNFWTSAGFARAVGVSDSAVAQWRKIDDPSLPKEISSILFALFGTGDLHAAARAELESAFRAACERGRGRSELKSPTAADTSAPNREPPSEDRDVFISYARPSAPRVNTIETALRNLGYSVWTDAQLPVHEAYDEVIKARVDGSRAVLVVWSKAASASQWVRSEADRARNAKKLVQSRVEDVDLPLPFDRIQCADLSAWNGEAEAANWLKVLDSVRALTGGPSGPPAADVDLDPPRDGDPPDKTPIIRSPLVAAPPSEAALAEVQRAEVAIARQLAGEAVVTNRLADLLKVPADIPARAEETARALITSGPREALRILFRAHDALVRQNAPLRALATLKQVGQDIVFLVYQPDQIEALGKGLNMSGGLLVTVPVHNPTFAEIAMAKLEGRPLRLKRSERDGNDAGAKPWREGVNLIPLPPESGPDGFDRFRRDFERLIFERTLNPEELAWPSDEDKRGRANLVLKGRFTDIEGSLYFAVRYKLHQAESAAFEAFVAEFMKGWPAIKCFKLDRARALDDWEVAMLRNVLDMLPEDQGPP